MAVHLMEHTANGGPWTAPAPNIREADSLATLAARAGLKPVMHSYMLVYLDDQRGIVTTEVVVMTIIQGRYATVATASWWRSQGQNEPRWSAWVGAGGHAAGRRITHIPTIMDAIRKRASTA